MGKKIIVSNAFVAVVAVVGYPTLIPRPGVDDVAVAK
jgi:hypothetical protein